jgi:class 3 adenylate cyclase
MAKNVKRRLAAIRAADVVGYSQLMEDARRACWRASRPIVFELIDPAIAKDKG